MKILVLQICKIVYTNNKKGQRIALLSNHYIPIRKKKNARDNNKIVLTTIRKSPKKIALCFFKHSLSCCCLYNSSSEFHFDFESENWLELGMNAFSYKTHKNSMMPLKVKFKKDYSTRCLKIRENVSFNIVSEASYIYILSGHKLIKNGQFWRVFENLMFAVIQCYQTGHF